MKKTDQDFASDNFRALGKQLADVGYRCFEAGKQWLNDRRDEMNEHYGRDSDNTGRNDRGSRYGENREGGSRGGSVGGEGDYHRYDSDRGRAAYFSEGQRGGGRDYGPGVGGRYSSGEGDDASSMRQGFWDTQNEPRSGLGRFGGSPSAQNYGRSNEGGGQRQDQRYGQNQGWGQEQRYGQSQGWGQDQRYGQGSGQSEGQGYGGAGYGAFGGYEGGYGRGGESQGYGSSNMGRNQGWDQDRSAYDSGQRGGEGRSSFGGSSSGSSSGSFGGSSGQYGSGSFQTPFGGGSRGQFSGKGPKNYSRSDERIAEDINERLYHDPDIDASEVDVQVQDGKVTLEGSVEQRSIKHRIEDLCEACSGVKDVDNRLRVSKRDGSSDDEDGSSRQRGGSTSSDMNAGAQGSGSRAASASKGVGGKA